jgi:hypothetical protein
MERADEVLPGAGVHADLAADGGVEHREERRRHLDERDAAEVRGGDEAGEVARDAAPERDDRRIAAEAERDEIVGEAGPGVARLRGFARRKGEGAPAVGDGIAAGALGGAPCGIRPVEELAIELRDGLIADECRAARAEVGADELGKAGKEAGLDVDRVLAALVRDGDGGPHGGARHQVTSPAPAR